MALLSLLGLMFDDDDGQTVFCRFLTAHAFFLTAPFMFSLQALLCSSASGDGRRTNGRTDGVEGGGSHRLLLGVVLGVGPGPAAAASWWRGVEWRRCESGDDGDDSWRREAHSRWPGCPIHSTSSCPHASLRRLCKVQSVGFLYSALRAITACFDR